MSDAPAPATRAAQRQRKSTASDSLKRQDAWARDPGRKQRQILRFARSGLLTFKPAVSSTTLDPDFDEGC